MFIIMVDATMAVVPIHQNALRLPVQLPMLNDLGLDWQPPKKIEEKHKIVQ